MRREYLRFIPFVFKDLEMAGVLPYLHGASMSQQKGRK